MVDQDETSTYSQIQSLKTDLIQATEIYPNPSSDFVNLKTYNWQNAESVEVRDVSANMFLHFSGSRLSSKIDVSKLMSATYLIETIRKNGKTDHKRFVIIR